jgi:hypothetical protein
VIHHDEIIDSRYLPTFNCNVIESGLHQIEGSSEYLLYCNDDFLFGREVEREDFLEKDERIRVLGTLFGERFRYRTYDAGHIFSLAFVEHVPVLIHKPSWSAMLDRYEQEVHRTREHRFREGSDLRMDRLHRYFLLAKRRELAKVVPFYKVCKVHQFHKITNKNPASEKASTEFEGKGQSTFVSTTTSGTTLTKR